MAKSKTTASNFSEIVKNAKSGTIKLPAFQRKWKWTTKQVMSLYDSLRMEYPIGSFLFMSSKDMEKLSPRPFHGSGKKAASNLSPENLVLDGQQRITAGLAIYYGLSEADGSEYYIDLNKIHLLVKEKRINIEDENEVIKFSNNIDLDDGYLIAKKKRKDRASHFHNSKFIWTAYLTDENQDIFDEFIDEIKDNYEKTIIRKIIKRHFKPNLNVQVPIIELGSDFDLGAVSRVFTTINTTGKLLTPFELVVAMLFPKGVKLEDDITEFKNLHPYYSQMDRNGEILLQTIAMFADKSPKKSDLPKNIDHNIYEKYSIYAAEWLDRLGQWLTNSLGLGLDITDKLIPYDAIFAPMTLVYKYIEESEMSHQNKAIAKRKLHTWFVGSVLSQRYQEGVHNKQSNDFKDIKKWVDANCDSKKPKWLSETNVTPILKNASPSGAIGRLIMCILNHNKPIDPINNENIGFQSKVQTTTYHHIFPTKWVSKGIVDYSKESMDTNLALNIMLLSSKTNSDWLNFDPKAQIDASIKALGDISNTENVYEKQMISKESLDILSKNNKSMNDYDSFIENRYKSFVKLFQKFDFKEAIHSEMDSPELESPSIMDD